MLFTAWGTKADKLSVKFAVMTRDKNVLHFLSEHTLKAFLEAPEDASPTYMIQVMFLLRKIRYI